jgi:hypothetical protein
VRICCASIERGYDRALLPNLICIGAAKCATTSLHSYLGLHPEVFMAEAKELDFFNGPGWNWDRGLSWYESQFPVDAPVRGETSPGYTVDPFVQGVPQRISETLPEVKLIYLVGDPIDRIVSDWVGNAARGWETKPLATLLETPDFEGSGYVARSRYAHQLGLYLKVFPREDVEVVVKEDLIAKPQETMRQIFEFLGVDPGFTTEGFGQVHNPSAPKRRGRQVPGWLRLAPLIRLKRRITSSGGLGGSLARRALEPVVSKPVLGEAEAARLRAWLADDAATLRELTGLDLSGWSV